MGIKYADLQSHVNFHCGRKIIECKNEGCGQLITQEILEAHNRICVDISEINTQISDEEKKEALKFVFHMFKLIDEENIQNLHDAFLHLIHKKLENIGKFLDSEQIKIIFDKLLKYTFKTIDDNYAKLI